MSCDTIIAKSGRDQKEQRKQYPDYITYLKNREADKFFNQAMEEGAAADVAGISAEAKAAAETRKNKHLKNAIRLNPYDVEAGAALGAAGELCPKGERDVDAPGGFDKSINGIKIVCD